MKHGQELSLSFHRKLRLVEKEIDKCDERFALLGEMVNLANKRRALMQRRNYLRKRLKG